LRGKKSGAAWYLEEVTTCAKLGVAHYDLKLIARKAPSPDRIQELLRIFRSAPRPVLIHCRGGADRSGLAAALWKLVINGTSKPEAGQQLSIRYGHLPFGPTRAMDAFLENWVMPTQPGMGAEKVPRDPLNGSILLATHRSVQRGFVPRPAQTYREQGETQEQKGHEMKRIVLPLIGMALILLGAAALAAAVEKADAVYLHGNIYTVDDRNPTSSAMAIKDGRFIRVGTDAAVKTHIGGNTMVFDLNGRTVLPGLIDSHLHFSAIGEYKMKLDLFWKPKREILDRVAEAYRKAEAGEWIEGFGWNQEVWDPPAFPTKAELDEIAPDIPVYLARTDGHAAWVNSKALEAAGVTRDTPNPPGGEIIKDARGEPIGMLTDTAESLVSRHIPPPGRKRILQALIRAQDELLSNGVTSAQDAGADLETIDRLKQLYASGDLTVRLYERLVVPENGPAQAEALYAGGKQIGLYHDRLTIRGVKLFVDGALGSRGALMIQPYDDRPDYRGNQRITEADLYALVRRARDAGFQVSAHAIGDGANRMVLDVFERVLKEKPDPDPRYRIEHAQVVLLQDIPRFARLGVIPSMQTVHATSDMNMAEKRIGPERIKGAYAWRKFLDSGSIIANGTDAPVELVNPFHGLYAAVTRQDRDGRPQGGWHPEERMTRVEALKSYTLWGAYAAFEETIKGAIQRGKLADFVVIDRDYMNCGQEEIKDIRVLLTVLGGNVVYPVRKTSR
jgi:predicted amidohydrolase YtcJ